MFYNLGARKSSAATIYSYKPPLNCLNVFLCVCWIDFYCISAMAKLRLKWFSLSIFQPCLGRIQSVCVGGDSGSGPPPCKITLGSNCFSREVCTALGEKLKTSSQDPPPLTDFSWFAHEKQTSNKAWLFFVFYFSMGETSNKMLRMLNKQCR